MTPKKLLSDHDMGENSDICCMIFGITNVGTIIPPIAAKMIFDTPPIVDASSLDDAIFAIRSPKDMALKDVKMDIVKTRANPPLTLSASSPSKGKIYIPAKNIIST